MQRSIIVSFYAASAFVHGLAIVVVLPVWMLLYWQFNAIEASWALITFVYGCTALLAGVGLWQVAPWAHKAFVALFVTAIPLVVIDGVLESNPPLQIAALAVAIALMGVIFVKYVRLYTERRAQQGVPADVARPAGERRG